MPGRLAIYDDIKFKEDIFNIIGDFKDDVQVLEKRYNIAPTISIPIFTNTKQYTYSHFGLIPSWAKNRSSININARSESIFEKSSFREAYKKRRCIIPINGYYEWIKNLQTKESTPYLISSSTNNYFALAGIYEYWYDNALGKTVLSCALITTEPNGIIKTIHDRMPVILEQKDWNIWLNKKSSYEDLNTLYTPLSSEYIAIREVNSMVNSIRNDSIECIKDFTKTKLIQKTLF